MHFNLYCQTIFYGQKNLTAMETARRVVSSDVSRQWLFNDTYNKYGLNCGIEVFFWFFLLFSKKLSSFASLLTRRSVIGYFVPFAG